MRSHPPGSEEKSREARAKARAAAGQNDWLAPVAVQIFPPCHQEPLGRLRNTDCTQLSRDPFPGLLFGLHPGTFVIPHRVTAGVQIKCSSAERI
jgi:hypothetical protein